MGNTNNKIYQQENYTNYREGKIDLTSLDPYKVLGVSKNYTWNELKEAYKNLAIQTHPDKGGDKLIFNFITDCFKELALEYKNRKKNKSHKEMKTESEEYIKKMTTSEYKHPSELLSGEKFEKRFNKIFEECKYVDEEKDFGYGSIMIPSSSKREDINIDNVFNKKDVDSNTFNSTFNKKLTLKEKKEIIKFKEPEALHLVNTDFTQIGIGRPTDYSNYSSGIALGRKLNYTDYMKAYSNDNFINPDEVQRKDFKNVEEFEKYRDKRTNKQLSKEERDYLENKKKEEELKEFERLERIKKQDLLIKQAHDKANRFLLK